MAQDGPAPVAPVARRTNGASASRAVLAAEEEIAGVRLYHSRQGVPILVRHKPGAAITHLGVFSLGGARDEAPASAGITTLMARSSLKGTSSRSAADIATDAEFLGGTVVSSVGAENFGWSISVPTRGTEAALALLADVVQHPTFPDAALETERALLLADLASLRDDMYRYPVRLATEAAFRAHPYGMGTFGSDALVRALTIDAVRQWHAGIRSGPLVIAIVGDVETDHVAAAAAAAFPELAWSQTTPLDAPVWPTGPQREIEQRDKAQTAMALAFPGPARRDDDRYTAHIIATLASGLGGRFFDELRDKRSLAYTVHAFAAERTLAGMFIAYIATSPLREDEARAGLLAEFGKLRDTPVSVDELLRAQAYTIGAHAIRQQSGASVLGDLIDAWFFGRGLVELDQHDARVLAVTTDAVIDVANRYFDPRRIVEGIVRGAAAV